MKKQIQTSFALCVYLLLAGLIQTPARGQEVPVIEIPLPEPVATMSAPEPEQVADLPLVEAAPTAPAAEVEYVDYAVTPAETMLEPETRIEDGEQKITITLDGVSLEDTLRMFAQTARANIIAAPNLLTGLFVNVSLNDVEWIPALRSILEIHNFTLAERTPGSGVFTVQKRGADAPEPTQIKTFFLDYTTAGEVHRAVDEMLPPEPPPANKEEEKRLKKYKAMRFESRNALVVRSTEANIGELENLIRELDRPGKQILVEAKILELSDEASKQLGIRWDSLEAFGVRAGLGPFTESRSESDVIERSRVDERQQTRQFDYLDSRNRFTDRGSINEQSSSSDQSSIENTRNESSVSIPGGSSFLNSLNASSDQASSSSRNNSLRDNQGSASEFLESTSRLDRESLSSGIVDSFTRTISRQQSAILEMDALQVVLSALEKTDGVSVVSNPKMIIASGATNAFFRVGDREPIIRTEVTKGTAESPGDTITASLDLSITANENNRADFIRGGYLETGIDLGVVATIKTDDFIEAYIRPVLRRLIGQKEVAGNFWPIISVKEIGTSFTLRSGQTVAIGGLTDTVESKETSRVPILGSIPVFGRLFSHTKDVKQQLETIIFVTLSVADPVNLEHLSGVPEDARLVHDRILLLEAMAAAATNQTDQVSDEQPTRKKKRNTGPRR